MKNSKLLGILATFLVVFFVSCDNSDEGNSETQSVELPPFETMAFDFEGFMDDPQAIQSPINRTAPNGNWVFSRLVVGVWNTALFSTLAVPVASFHAAFNHDAEVVGDLKWQWSYSVAGFTSEYTARLTGEIVGEEVVWEMYVTKMGIEPFEEFLWFSGVSDLDGNSGHWLLNESHDRPDAMLRIDWERSGEDVGSIRYTWVRELDANENDDLFRDSYLQYGLQDGDYDAYLDLHAYDENLEDFSDVRIEWNRTDYFGRVRAFQYFQDELWHCWDSTGEDSICE
ncbi:MAG: hypothetical protein ACR2MM_09530 [Flavobacteriaceae bacterium]